MIFFSIKNIKTFKLNHKPDDYSTILKVVQKNQFLLIYAEGFRIVFHDYLKKK